MELRSLTLCWTYSAGVPNWEAGPVGGEAFFVGTRRVTPPAEAARAAPPWSNRDGSVIELTEAAEQLRSSREPSYSRQRREWWPLGTGQAMTRDMALRVGVTALAG